MPRRARTLPDPPIIHRPPGDPMPAVTPDLADLHAPLAALASRFVDVQSLTWRDTRFPKIKVKVLMEDKATGLLTTLFLWEPGAVLPDHEHVEIEQSYVLSGELEDDEGVCGAGNYVWRPAGSRHEARSPKGALILAFFLKPNRFFDIAAPMH
jgi:quercetin dioxygenase-like cupin family protein